MLPYLFCCFLSVFAVTIPPYYDEKNCGKKTYMHFAENPNVKAIHDTPWYATIFFELPQGIHTCGGTLISKKHVITAAHCFKVSNSHKLECSPDAGATNEVALSSTTVFLGQTCLDRNIMLNCMYKEQLGKRFGVKRIEMGPFFNTSCNKGGDYALIELEEPYDDSSVMNHACLPHLHPEMTLNNATARVAGFGEDPLHNYIGRSNPVLQSLEVDTLDKDTCNENHGGNLPDDAFCTSEADSKDVCAGDSGGGFTFNSTSSSRRFIAGVVSFGTDCSALVLGGKRAKGNVNTDISQHVDHINRFIGVQ